MAKSGVTYSGCGLWGEHSLSFTRLRLGLGILNFMKWYLYTDWIDNKYGWICRVVVREEEKERRRKKKKEERRRKKKERKF